MAAHNPAGRGRPDEEAADRPSTPLHRFTTAEALRALAFWSAVALPFLHLPLLATGLDAPGEIHAFGTLLTLNALALYAGHPHGRD